MDVFGCYCSFCPALKSISFPVAIQITNKSHIEYNAKRNQAMCIIKAYLEKNFGITSGETILKDLHELIGEVLWNITKHSAGRSETGVLIIENITEESVLVTSKNKAVYDAKLKEFIESVNSGRVNDKYFLGNSTTDEIDVIIDDLPENSYGAGMIIDYSCSRQANFDSANKEFYLRAAFSLKAAL